MATAIENHVHTLRNRLQGSQLAHFLSWWLCELRKLLPAGLQVRMQHARRRVIMQIEGQELGISVGESDTLHQLDVLSLEQDTRLQRQQLHDLFIKRELTEVARDLLLPESRVFRRDFDDEGC